MSAFYGADLAHAHDAGFGFLARAAASRLVSELRAAGHEGGLVVDLGCGTGIAAERLLDAGYEVLGADVSAEMLAIARGRAPRGEFTEADAFELELPRCVAIAATGEVLGYATSRDRGPEDLAAFFARARDALVPGGVLLFDLAGPDRDPAARRAWHEGEGWLVCMEAAQEEPGRTLVRRVTTFRRAGEGWRRDDEVHRLRLHAPREVLARLRAADFEARIEGGYEHGADRVPGLHVFVTSKPLALRSIR